MTAVVDVERADRGLLSALAIAYGKARHDKASKLAHASAHVGRLLSSTSELTAEEARQLRRHVPRCAPGTCTVTPPAPQTCSCSVGGTPGRPSACDPRGVGRYCPGGMCWCGSCPWWSPAPEPNYAAALAKLAEKAGHR